ncbi:MAG: mechanosensitive ion channel family protein [Oscillospiraceae bacterium]|nr:mechanosensitive ion channel family protein [Oscillospiraceae bacterium]MBQ7130219.1 mechanosensitive ion channel family protein [Oscillospiraceae bacterium]
MNEAIFAILSSGLFRKFCTALIVLVIGILAIRIIGKVLKKALEKSKLEKAAHTLITSLAKTALYILLGLIVASTLGIDVTSIVALASVLTLALSLALQNMVSNIIGGFTILYTHPFHSGDFVEIAGQAGTVQEINMSYTKLATPDNKVISIPNSAVVAAQIVNYSAEETRRVDVSITASYAMPTQKVLDALALAGTMDNVLLTPAPQALIMNYGESSIEYALRVWVKSADYWDVYFALNKRVKDIFDEQGILMTYPHLNVHIQN